MFGHLPSLLGRDLVLLPSAFPSLWPPLVFQKLVPMSVTGRRGQWNSNSQEFQLLTNLQFSVRTCAIGASEWVVMRHYWWVFRGSLCLVFPNNLEEFHYYGLISVAVSLGNSSDKVTAIFEIQSFRWIRGYQLDPGMVVVIQWTRGHRCCVLVFIPRV